MITDTRIFRSRVGNKSGWAFSVYFDGRGYPTFVSALYKTRKETGEQLTRYKETGDFDLYGTAGREPAKA